MSDCPDAPWGRFGAEFQLMRPFAFDPVRRIVLSGSIHVRLSRFVITIPKAVMPNWLRMQNCFAKNSGQLSLVVI